MRLGADLGGTHARFALQSDPVRQVELAARDYGSIDAAITAALAAFGIDDARAIDAVLAVAGPVRGSCASFTNLEWHADADALRARFGFATVRLLNDVECAAHGAASSLPTDVIDIQPGVRNADARHVLVSVGTGLGVAYWRGAGDVEATEAGHAGFAPTTEWERSLLEALSHDGPRVPWEHVLSGPGLARIHTVVSGVPCTDAPWVSERAAHGDAYAGESVRRFSRLLGAFAGDLVLAAPVTGGVLLAGGVLQGLGDQFDADEFVAGFRDKGRMSAITAALPVWRTADGGLALRGALL